MITQLSYVISNRRINLVVVLVTFISLNFYLIVPNKTIRQEENINFVSKHLFFNFIPPPE